MHGELFVDAAQHAIHLLAQRVDVLVVDVDRIHMDDEINAGLLPDALLRLVDLLVYGDKIAVARHLGVQRGKSAACAVVVNDQVVNADDVLGVEHDMLDILRHDRIGGLAEQRRYRIARDADARPDDERRDQNAHIAVNRQRGETARDHAEYNDRGRDHIVAAVLTGRDEYRRVDAAAERGVEQPHPQLDEHGDRQNTGQKRGKRDGGRMNDAVERRFEEFEADQQDDERNDQAGDVLRAAVAERMLFVRFAV